MIVLTNALLRDYAVHCGAARPTEGVLHLLGMRGCRLYPAGAGKVAISLVEPIPNSYDDLVGYFGLKLALYPGTVDPGRFYSQHPLRQAGCAHTVGLDEPGGKPFSRFIGSHKRQPAFVQGEGKVVVWRDRDRDMQQDPDEQPRSEIGMGCNLHKMGQIRSDIGKWSAGCWGVMDQYWKLFWEAASIPPQLSYTNYQFDAHEFAHWFDTGRV